jgi:hypothetical protein
MDMNTDKGLIVIDEKKTTPLAAYEVLAASLEWAIDLACTSSRPSLPNHVSGLAAYDAWASGLEVDADYPLENLDMMATRTMIHGDQCTMLDERREAARFLRRMKHCAPRAADSLEHASVYYDEVADLCTKVWPWPVDTNAVAMQALAKGHTRRELASYIRRAREWETSAVAYLRQALAALTK